MRPRAGLGHSPVMKDAPVVQGVAAIASEPGNPSAGRFSRMADGLVFSEILKIAGEIRTLKAAGQSVCDLTVGDFDPRHFPIPDRLRDAIAAALAAGETNYPPSNGHADAAGSRAALLRARAGPRVPVESCVVAGGSRPLIYSLFRTLVDPGDHVVYPVPSWNNNHYTYLVGGRGGTGRLPGRRPLPADPRPAARGPAGRAPAVPQLAAQPHGHRVHRSGAAGHLRARARGERGPRAAAASGRSTSCTTTCTGCSASAAPPT